MQSHPAISGNPQGFIPCSPNFRGGDKVPVKKPVTVRQHLFCNRAGIIAERDRIIEVLVPVTGTMMQVCGLKISIFNSCMTLTAKGFTRIGATPAETTAYRPPPFCWRTPSAMGDLTELKEQIKITRSFFISAPPYPLFY